MRIKNPKSVLKSQKSSINSTKWNELFPPFKLWCPNRPSSFRSFFLLFLQSKQIWKYANTLMWWKIINYGTRELPLFFPIASLNSPCRLSLETCDKLFCMLIEWVFCKFAVFFFCVATATDIWEMFLWEVFFLCEGDEISAA